MYVQVLVLKVDLVFVFPTVVSQTMKEKERNRVDRMPRCDDGSSGWTLKIGKERLSKARRFGHVYRFRGRLAWITGLSACKYCVAMQ